MKTNNLFGIKNPLPQRWLGSTGENEHGTAIFTLPHLSARAFFLNAHNQLQVTPKNLFRFLTDYAPPSDPIGSIPGNPPNDPLEYLAFVESSSPIAPLFWDLPLPLPRNEPAVWFALALAISQYETGKPPLTGRILMGLYDFITIAPLSDEPPN